MSNKERAIELLDQVPDYKMGYVLAYIQGITADEEADDIGELIVFVTDREDGRKAAIEFIERPGGEERLFDTMQSDPRWLYNVLKSSGD